jgi:predicted ATPase with chaperone activity
VWTCRSPKNGWRCARRDAQGSRDSLSARACTRALRVALTIADLAGESRVSEVHLTEALGYRGISGPTLTQRA